MKLLRNYLFQTFVFVVSVVLMQSCSCNKDNDLDAKLNAVASDDTPILIVGNLERVIDQLEIMDNDGKLEMPRYMTDMINRNLGSRARRDAQSALDVLSNINHDNMVMAIDADERSVDAILVFAVDDYDDLEDALKEAIDDVDFDEEDDYNVITIERDLQILVKDNLAYVVANEKGILKNGQAVREIEKWRSNAESKPIAEWKRSYLKENNICNALIYIEKYTEMSLRSLRGDEKALAMSIMKELNFGAYVKYSVNLEGPTMSIKAVNVDNNGNAVKLNCTGTFDTSLMNYATSNDIMAASVCMNQTSMTKVADFLTNTFKSMIANDDYYSQSMKDRQIDEFRSIVNLPSQYMSNGGAFAAVGLNPGVTPDELESYKSYHFVGALALQPGKANEAYDYLTNLLEQTTGIYGQTADTGSMRVKVYGIQNARYDWYADDYVYETMNVYVALDGNNLVVSNAPISKNGGSPFSASVFTGSTIAFQGVLTPRTPGMSELGITNGLNVTAKSDVTTGEFNVTITGTDQKFVPAVFSMLSKAGV